MAFSWSSKPTSWISLEAANGRLCTRISLQDSTLLCRVRQHLSGPDVSPARRRAMARNSSRAGLARSNVAAP